MNPAAAFFLIALSLQAVFVAAVILIVARRFPARLRLYRFVAPAAVPILLFLMVTLAFLKAGAEAGIPPELISNVPIIRFAMGYGVLWLTGVLFASMLIRFARR